MSSGGTCPSVLNIEDAFVTSIEKMPNFYPERQIIYI